MGQYFKRSELGKHGISTYAIENRLIYYKTSGMFFLLASFSLSNIVKAKQFHFSFIWPLSYHHGVYTFLDFYYY